MATDGPVPTLGRVLVLSASAGAGHVRAAQALEKALAAAQAATEVRHVDVLQYTTKAFRRVYAKAYLDLVTHAPEVLGWLYEYLDTPWKHARLRLALDALNARPFIRLLTDYRPDWALCTHFLPAELIAWLRTQGRLDTRQAVIVTDVDVHAMWLTRPVERYCVAREETAVHLARLGVPAETISVTGIPIDPVFAEPKDPQAMRRRHNLAPDRTTLLVSAGGFGVGPIEQLVRSLLPLQHAAQVVVLCGRSDELRQRIAALATEVAPTSPISLLPVGYTTAMDEYMAAADLMIGKPGGLTTSEALARGLPMVIVNPIPGQEERNADYLLEEGAAIRGNNLPALAWKLDRLLDDTSRLVALRANAQRIARPHAARDVVAALHAVAGAAEEAEPWSPPRRSSS
jgi:processive 1,2-diacylglycerol beta-glucosyltransferase